ncbi:MAG: glucose 1-dehydrogenase [Bdellovibrionales bacterium]|nr:glucose 1-dehydrogenase [Bdellovibrionales bacterium]
MKELEGKVALITGSDSGIGQATAINFAKEGANIIIHYHSDEEGAKLTLEKVRKAGSDGIIVKADVRHETEVEEMFQKALDKWGTVDILMNNAGIDASGSYVADMSTERWMKAIETNLNGYFFCARRFINIRKKAGGRGKIINVTSVHDEIPRAGAADYDCTKGAIKNLTRTLALELAEDGINVNNIAPGMVLTPFNQKAVDDPEVREKQVQSIPMKRAAEPEEIAGLALFLASEKANYVTGSTYVMDGGLMQNMGQGA